MVDKEIKVHQRVISIIFLMIQRATKDRPVWRVQPVLRQWGRLNAGCTNSEPVTRSPVRTRIKDRSSSVSSRRRAEKRESVKYGQTSSEVITVLDTKPYDHNAKYQTIRSKY